MKGLLVKGLVTAAVIAAIMVPAASAKPATAVKVSILPLPSSAIGSAAKSLPLQADSGPISNTVEAGLSLRGATPKTFTKLGRITGYGLDYGIGPSGGSGVTEVWTSADEYKTAADAKKGLAFWKKDDPAVAQLNQGGFAVTHAAVTVPAVGSARFASLAGFSSANIVPAWQIDEQFTQGRYVGDVSVWAGSAAAAKSLAPTLAKKLDARLKQAIAGKLHATPVSIPKQKAGAPAGGSDLSTLALKTSDLSGTATIKSERYYADPYALSDYGVFMFPAGQFGLLDQEIEWYATANQASFETDFAVAQFLRGGGSQVDLSGVGDGAQGVLANASSGGFGEVVLASGHLAEFISLGSQSSIQTSDVQNVAQKAASYINSAGLGS